MYRALVSMVFCLALCACGGGGSTANSVTPSTSTSMLSDYEGFYIGTIEYSSARNGNSAPISFNLDDSGNFYGVSSITTEAEIISAGHLKANGQVQGSATFVNELGQPLSISSNGTIDLAHGGNFDITFTYSGVMNGSSRIRGTRVQISAKVSTASSIINLGQSVTLSNNSMITGLIYPVSAAGIIIPTSMYSWSIKSAPNGSLATFCDVSQNSCDKIFIPDRKGTYIITLTANNGALGSSSADISINVI